MKTLIALVAALVFMATGRPAIVSERISSLELVRVGGTIRVNGLAVTLNSVRWDDGDELTKPLSPEKMLVLDVSVLNERPVSTSVSSRLMFGLLDHELYSKNMQFMTETKGSLDGELDAGGTMNGEIVFTVPKEETQWEFMFDPDALIFGEAIFVVHETDVE